MPASSPNINNNFFHGFYQHAWKQTIPPGLTEAEVDFIQDVGHLQQGQRVLDLMCGYGRHALELGRRKLKVTAVDNLKQYIEEIKNTAIQEQIAVEVLQNDVIDLNLEGQFDMTICMGNSFAFFNRKDAISILKNVSAHLKKSGILIINSWMIAEIALKYFREKDWHYAGEYKCLLDYQFKFYPARIESEQTIISSNGEVEVVKGVDYIFTLDQLEDIFQEAGLQTVHLYSTPRKKNFVFGDSRIYIVAKKLG